jgi:hypothetical protein
MSSLLVGLAIVVAMFVAVRISFRPYSRPTVVAASGPLGR